MRIANTSTRLFYGLLRVKQLVQLLPILVQGEAPSSVQLPCFFLPAHLATLFLIPFFLQPSFLGLLFFSLYRKCHKHHQSFFSSVQCPTTIYAFDFSKIILVVQDLYMNIYSIHLYINFLFALYIEKL